MLLLIAGSRTITDYYITLRAYEAFYLRGEVTGILTGAARKGPDRHAYQIAESFNLPLVEQPADWIGNAGKGAGMARNSTMAVECDAAIILWDGQSHGTADMIKKMRAVEKPLWVIDLNKPHTWPRGWVAPTGGERGSTVTPSMDFEVYSEAGYILDETTGKVYGGAGKGSGKKRGLELVGTPVYAEHPTTEPLCLYYNLKDGYGLRAWIPDMTPPPQPLFDWLASGGMVEAWNITFEWWIWNLTCKRRYNWPDLPLEQCICVMSRARRFSYPAGLDNAAQVVGLEQKDKEGKQLIRLLCVPCTKTKDFKQWRKTPTTHPQLFAKMYAYCGQDTISEDSVASRLPDLSPYEREAWLTDQRINARGVAVDVETLEAALFIMDQMFNRYTLELANLTDGAVGSASEIEKLLGWLKTRHEYLPDLTADTVDAAIERINKDGGDAGALRALEIRQTLSSANIKKLVTLKMQLNSDNRLRNQYAYCGADRTGRFSSGGVQLQNITSKGPAVVRCNHCGAFMRDDVPSCGFCGSTDLDHDVEWSVDAAVQAVPDLRARDLDYIMARWKTPEKLLAGVLRALFIPKPGYKFICCDFSAIEAVGLAALSRCPWRLEVFATHGRIYEMSASKTTGIPFEEFMAHKKETGHDHPLRKKIGKPTELGLGYGGWIGALKAFGADKYFDDDKAMRKVIIDWRNASPEVVEFWGGQYRETSPGSWEFYPERFGLEGAAIEAVLNPGNWYAVGDIQYGSFNDILFCRLPSGRYLHYHQPRLVETMDRRAKAPSYQLTYMGWNTNTKFGSRGWTRLETYGGKQTENADQATCLDIQWCALMRLERNSHPVVMHTHDEAICEVPIGFGSVKGMEELMATREEWFSWWPVKAAGWEGDRYRKD